MFFFFNDTATTEIYTLSLHDALPISRSRIRGLRERRRSQHRFGRDDPEGQGGSVPRARRRNRRTPTRRPAGQDRKSTRLNSSHLVISYAVFCLKKKKQRRADYLSRQV